MSDGGGARSGTLSLRRRLAMLFGVALFVVVVLLAVGASAFVGLLDARKALVDRLGPAQLSVSGYFTALLNQETGARGFVLTGDDRFLEPYQAGRKNEDAALAAAVPNLRQFPALRADVAQLRQVVEAWHTGFVEPAIATVRRGERVTEERLSAGKVAFDRVRDAYDGLYADLDQQRQTSRVRLNRVTTRLTGALVGSVAALVAMGLLIWLAFRRWVAAPLARLGGDARLVADGNLSHEVAPTGPAEFQALGRDLEAMRVRIVAEVDTLEVRSTDLARSNADLEQFAYVASHDLQEPLRKVASFCQLLQKRYQGQLDERADQYIEFAVDGAKRMQALINDLLTFSRVGRLIGDLAEVDCDVALTRALANVETACEEAAATVVVDALPVVRGDLSLLTALFQNLVDNAIKYRRPDVAPGIRVTVARVDDNWEFAVADNGIGIAPEYAERVFVIFQRLHAKEEYSGTGIGLALCKRIVEFHGGRIWVDTDRGPSGPDRAGDRGPGTTVRWVLPVYEPTEPAEPAAPSDREPNEQGDYADLGH